MAVMRYQLAYPETVIPIIGQWLFAESGGIMLPENYNTFGAMHGTIMIFLGVVPLAVGAFGNYLVPLQIGAPDMAFPKLNAASYWTYFVGGVVMMASFFTPEGAARSGWTSYPPLSIFESGQTMWLLSMVFLITSSLLGSMNIIVTIVQLRAPGLTWFKLPFFIWTQLVTSFLLVLAFPPLEAAAVLQLMDRIAGTSFLTKWTCICWKKPLQPTEMVLLFCGNIYFGFLAHPEVYVLILPAIGIVGEILANNTRKPLWGYKSLVYAISFLGFMSFIVWASSHVLDRNGSNHECLFPTYYYDNINPLRSCSNGLFYIPLGGGSIRFNTPMLFALSFLPMFGIGGLTGLPLGVAASDIYLHDTYYVIGHLLCCSTRNSYLHYLLVFITGSRRLQWEGNCT